AQAQDQEHEDEHEHEHDHDHDHEHDHEHEHDHDHDHDHDHEHDHGPDCTCGCHDHDHDHEHGHHHHHHADDVFQSWGVETPRAFTAAELEAALAGLDSGRYGAVLRAKGIVPAAGGKWLHFDYVPEEHNVREGSADYTGRLCVIGSGLDQAALAALFHLA
ncbi:MAG: GTP-binding protein, partial [Oscillospiraceae bacterium]|nr:GTP-binding protein [Oscillospiraceae bacterium]